MTKALLFDDITRTETRYALPGDAQFDYLNCSARPLAGLVRATVDGWFEHYPVKGREERRIRFRGGDVDHFSAFHELAVHELLRRSGNEVVEVHPDLAHTSKQPEFRVRAPDKSEFIVEALNVMGRSAEEAKSIARIDEVLRIAEDLEAPKHWLMVHHRRLPKANLPLTQIKKDLQAYAAALPVGKTSKQYTFEREDFVFRVRVSERGKPALPGERSVGGVTPGAHYSEIVDEMKNKLKKKISKYGEFDQPYVIAVNRLAPSFKVERIEEVLFGHEREEAAAPGEYSRQLDGLLFDEKGPRKRRLSGVIAFKDLRPWETSLRRAKWLANPFAKHPCPPLTLGIDEIEANELGVLTEKAGKPLREIFELQAWVEEEP